MFETNRSETTHRSRADNKLRKFVYNPLNNKWNYFASTVSKVDIIEFVIFERVWKSAKKNHTPESARTITLSASGKIHVSTLILGKRGWESERRVNVMWVFFSGENFNFLKYHRVRFHRSDPSRDLFKYFNWTTHCESHTNRKGIIRAYEINEVVFGISCFWRFLHHLRPFCARLVCEFLRAKFSTSKASFLGCLLLFRFAKKGNVFKAQFAVILAWLIESRSLFIASNEIWPYCVTT